MKNACRWKAEEGENSKKKKETSSHGSFPKRYEDTSYTIFLSCSYNRLLWCWEFPKQDMVCWVNYMRVAEWASWKACRVGTFLSFWIHISPCMSLLIIIPTKWHSRADRNLCRFRRHFFYRINLTNPKRVLNSKLTEPEQYYTLFLKD